MLPCQRIGAHERRGSDRGRPEREGGADPQGRDALPRERRLGPRGAPVVGGSDPGGRYNEVHGVGVDDVDRPRCLAVVGPAPDLGPGRAPSVVRYSPDDVTTQPIMSVAGRASPTETYPNMFLWSGMFPGAGRQRRGAATGLDALADGDAPTTWPGFADGVGGPTRPINGTATTAITTAARTAAAKKGRKCGRRATGRPASNDRRLGQSRNAARQCWIGLGWDRLGERGSDLALEVGRHRVCS